MLELLELQIISLFFRVISVIYCKVRVFRILHFSLHQSVFVYQKMSISNKFFPKFKRTLRAIQKCLLRQSPELFRHCRLSLSFYGPDGKLSADEIRHNEPLLARLALLQPISVSLLFAKHFLLELPVVLDYPIVFIDMVQFLIIIKVRSIFIEGGAL